MVADNGPRGKISFLVGLTTDGGVSIVINKPKRRVVMEINGFWFCTVYLQFRKTFLFLFPFSILVLLFLFCLVIVYDINFPKWGPAIRQCPCSAPKIFAPSLLLRHNGTRKIYAFVIGSFFFLFFLRIL